MCFPNLSNPYLAEGKLIREITQPTHPPIETHTCTYTYSFTYTHTHTCCFIFTSHFSLGLGLESESAKQSAAITPLPPAAPTTTSFSVYKYTTLWVSSSNTHRWRESITVTAWDIQKRGKKKSFKELLVRTDLVMVARCAEMWLEKKRCNLLKKSSK